VGSIRQVMVNHFIFDQNVKCQVRREFARDQSANPLVERAFKGFMFARRDACINHTHNERVSPDLLPVLCRWTCLRLPFPRLLAFRHSSALPPIVTGTVYHESQVSCHLRPYWRKSHCAQRCTRETINSYRKYIVGCTYQHLRCRSVSKTTPNTPAGVDNSTQQNTYGCETQLVTVLHRSRWR